MASAKVLRDCVQANDSVLKIVHFKGFAKNTREDIILSIFAKYGSVRSPYFGKDKNGIFLGHGSVSYENEEIAARAIQEISGMVVSGRKITVEKFLNKKDRDFNNVFVKNFKDDVESEDQLKDYFERFGEITSIRVVRDERGMSKGFGFVCFAKAADAKMAVECMHEHELPSGKALYVSKYEPKSQRCHSQRESSRWRPPHFPSNGSMPLPKQKYNHPTYRGRSNSNASLPPATLGTYVPPSFTQQNNETFRNVFVKNFAGVVENERELCLLFQVFGSIKSAKVVRDEHNRSRGFGFVCFYSPFSAKRAVESMSGRNIQGKRLFVGKASNKIECQRELRRTFLARFTSSPFSPLNKRQQPPRPRNINVASVDTQCCTCLLEIKASDCVWLSCRHMICKECIVVYVKHVVKNKDVSVDSILCPTQSDDCDAELTYDVIRELIPPDLFASYDECLLDNYLDNCEDIMWCPKAECRCAVYLTDNSPTLGSCPKCHFAFCTNCGEGYHGLSPCNEFENEAQRLEVIARYMNGSEEEKRALEKRYTKGKLEKEVQDHLSNLCIKKECKQCPSCKVNIHKYDGCNKVYCKCKIFFCWLCLTILDNTNPYNHFHNGKCSLYALPNNLN